MRWRWRRRLFFGRFGFRYRIFCHRQRVFRHLGGRAGGRTAAQQRLHRVDQLGLLRQAQLRERHGGEQRGLRVRRALERARHDGARRVVELEADLREARRKRIARRQAPFLLFLGLVTLIGGALLLTRASYLALHYDQMRSLLTIRSVIMQFGLGVVMVVGSAVGLGKAVIDMWK